MEVERKSDIFSGRLVLKVLCGAIIVAILTHLFLAEADVMEAWQEYAENYEEWELDEIPFIFFSISLYMSAILWLFLKRQRALASELAAEIQEKSFTEARLQEASTARERFFAAMSHDLRTPVNSIAGFAEMMRANVFGPLGHDKYQEYVEDIIRAATFLDMTIAQVLDVANHANSDGMAINDEVFNAFEEAKTCRDLLAGWNGARRQITMICDVVDPVIKFDRTMFRRFLVNLLSNAAKYAGRDARITILLTPSTYGSGIAVTVEDDGMGIQPTMLKEIRQPFSRGEMRKDSGTGGVGLGLWIVSQIAEAHDCPLEFDTAVDNGFRVKMTIPQSRVVSVQNETLTVSHAL